MRVVFDASCKTSNGLSLNDELLVGPTNLQNDLLSILLKWRKHAYVINADIEKMYRQIQVADEDTHYQKILWRDSPQKPIKEYRLRTVTFGTASTPYLAVRTLQQLANDNEEKYPLAAKATIDDFYVDDLLTGTDTIEQAIILQSQIITLLKLGGFDIRKGSSNHQEILKHVSPTHREISFPLSINAENNIKKLGIYWNPSTDSFGFKISQEESSLVYTKRTLLSEIAKIFDPLGWLAPTVIIAKIMMQDLWLTGLAWDDKQPNRILHHICWCPKPV